MSLVNMLEVIKYANEKNCGIGAFNALSIEAVRGAIRAAEELDTPIILQLAQVQLDAAPIEYIAPVMIEAAKRATVPVTVHYDHGEDIEHIKQALDLGFTSVMYDGASLPLKENIEISRQVKEMAKPYNATVEAELGQVGGGEDGKTDIEMRLTSVDEVQEFVLNTGVDALAIAIGNAHGPYKDGPDLQFGRLADINKCTDVPLVLHGGSGISDDGFRQCIDNGIRKINVATSIQQQVTRDVKAFLSNNNNENCYFELYETVEEAVYKEVKRNILVFNNLKS